MVSTGHDGPPRSGVGVDLTPATKKRKMKGGLADQLAQNCCNICVGKNNMAALNWVRMPKMCTSATSEPV